MTKIEQENVSSKEEKGHKASKNHKKKQKQKNKAMKTAINKNIEKVLENAKKDIKTAEKVKSIKKTKAPNHKTDLPAAEDNSGKKMEKEDQVFNDRDKTEKESKEEEIPNTDEKKPKKSRKIKAAEQPESVGSVDQIEENKDPVNPDQIEEEDPQSINEGAASVEPIKTDEAKKKDDGPDYSVFIGNLPALIKATQIKQMFKKFGEIKTIRFRTDDGAVIFHKKQLKKMKSISCYVRYVHEEDSKKALEMNNTLIENHHIRVNLANEKPKGHNKSTVFVGNISYNTTDNCLYEFFSKVGEIEFVRQVPFKGIAYICFKKGVSIAKALKLNQQILDGRPLRIQSIDLNRQTDKKIKKKKKKITNVINEDTLKNKNENSRPEKKKNKEGNKFRGKTGAINKKKGNNKLGKDAMRKKIMAKKLMFK